MTDTIGRLPISVDLAPRDMATGEATALVAKALGHPARIQIVRLLLEKQSCIGGDIVDEVGLAQSTVSEHLRILKSAGIITGEIERPRVCYSLNADSIITLTALLNAMIEQGRCREIRDESCCPPIECGSHNSFP